MLKKAAKEGAFKKVFEDFTTEAAVNSSIKLYKEQLKNDVAEKKIKMAYFVAEDAIESRNELIKKFQSMISKI